MKKTAVVLMITFISLIGACSKSGAEAEARAIIHDMTMAAETASEKLDKAASAREAADIIKTFRTDMEILGQKGKEYDKKHPEISVMNDKAFSTERAALMNSMKRYGVASMKVMIKFEGAEELAGFAGK